MHRCQQVDVDVAIDVVGRDCVHLAWVDQAGVVHQQVEIGVLGLNPVSDRADLLGRRQVCHSSLRVVQKLRRGRHPISVNVNEDQPVTLTLESNSDLARHGTAASGYQCCAITHVSVPSLEWSSADVS